MIQSGAVLGDAALQLVDQIMRNLPELKPGSARSDHLHMLRQIAFNAMFGVVLGLLVAATLIFFDIGGLGRASFARATPGWRPSFWPPRLR